MSLALSLVPVITTLETWSQEDSEPGSACATYPCLKTKYMLRDKKETKISKIG